MSVDRDAVQSFYAQKVKPTGGGCCQKQSSSCGTKPASGCCKKTETKGNACCQPNAETKGTCEAVYQESERLPCSSACDMGEGALGQRVKTALSNVHPDILSKNFGCGSPFPPLMEGCRVVDLGSGAGRDCFVISQLVGSQGYVIGVDMTPEMLETAEKFLPYHKDKTGLSNVEFRKGELENLVTSTGLQEGSIDVVTSNCVVNLTQNKRNVFENVFRLLKPGGEMYFSDVYTTGTVSEAAKQHVEAWNECYSGALPVQEFNEMVQQVGFLGPFITKSTSYLVPDALKDVLEGCTFVSNTVRLIKPSTTEQKVGTYKGTETFLFQLGTQIEPSKSTDVPASVRDAIARSRYAPFFE